MTSSHRGGSWEMQRRYSVPPNAAPVAPPPAQASAGDAARMAMGSASEDLHAWSIYRQNLNSDFTDSALGSTEKSPLPYGNFQLRDSTVQSILAHPRYGPKSALGSNMYTYLKFGLPRVFPPSRGGRDGSSGYDSSEDGSARRHHGKYLRARSDPDFRSQRPRGHEQQWAKPTDRGWSRGKSRSEANLLHAARAESQVQSQPHPAPAQMRRSLHDLRAPPSLAPLPGYLPPQHEQRSTRRSSKGSSHHVVVNNGPDPGPEEEDDPPPSYRHPHLQCINLAVEDSNGPLLSGVTMETFGGDVTAIMATSEEEGTALLEALSGRHRGKVRGQRLLNGRPIRASALRDRVAHSRAGAEMAQDLTVAQTLRMARWLRSVKPADKGQMQDRTTALLEELGLAQVSHTSVSRLTASEKSRLHVGCQLALDAALVTLDRPTRGMDIFDTFFLVEFLRQWASSRGAVVIMTLHPPTYEVFTMLSRVVLLSAGRTMFAGRTRAALPFFAACDFPCPAFKNPADYYLDLVTLDDLSAEAMLESSQRIAALAEAFQRRQPALAEPGPPVPLPPKIRHASFPSQCIAIATRAAVFSQPLTLVRWFALALLAALTSLALGAVFFALPATDPTLRLSDRLGLVNALTLGSWPLMLLLVSAEVKREHRSVESDIADRLYSRTAYFLTKTLVNLPMCACVWLAYLLPALIVSGLHPPGSDAMDLYLHLGYWLLHLLAIQQALTFLVLACGSRLVASGIALVVMSVLSLVSGQWLHPDDLHWPLVWLRMVSPQRWLLAAILPPQHSTHALALAALTCRSKQVQHQDIIVQLPCPAPDGAAALRWMGLAPDATPSWLLATAPAAFWLVALLLGGGAFLVRRLPRHVTPPRNNPNKP